MLFSSFSKYNIMKYWQRLCSVSLGLILVTIVHLYVNLVTNVKGLAELPETMLLKKRVKQSGIPEFTKKINLSENLVNNCTESLFTNGTDTFNCCISWCQNQLPNETQLVYNRLRKCGTTGMRSLISKLWTLNKFTLRNINYRKTFEGSEKIVKDMQQLRQPWLYVRYMKFIDFQPHGHRTPSYFNLVRDPVSRFVSFYNYQREPGRVSYWGRTSQSINMTLDDCVQSNHRECEDPAYTFQIVPYFCGLDTQCKTPSAWALNEAKKNVLNYYPVVGYLENMDQFLEAIEGVWPQYFKGASVVYKALLESPNSNIQNKRKDHKTPSNRSIEILKSKMSYEYEFYYFIKQRFHCTYKRYCNS